jgi:hypothetical protein
MENELELNQSYTADFLLNFLSENSRRNIFLASQQNLNLSNSNLSFISRTQKFIVYDVCEIFLHKFNSNGSYVINNDISKIYYIKPENT